MRFYGPFSRVIQAGYRIFHPGWRAENVPDGGRPVVFIIHHQNMFGPIHAIGILPVDAHMWSLECFTNQQTCFEHYYTYTYQIRYGWSKPRSYIMAKICSLVVPRLLNSFRAIPVRHDMGSMLTLRKALAALQRGEHMAICPDVEYSSPSPEMGEMYKGFLLLGRMYQKKTGQALPYVPVYCSKVRKRVICGEPIVFEEVETYTPEMQDEWIETLREGVNALGRQSGDIPG